MISHNKWATTVLLDDLVSRLNTLPFDRIVECIQRLPAIDRPSVNGRSHHKTIIGLVKHLLECIRYLTAIPIPLLCNIMEYCFPRKSLLKYQDMSESDCIAHILELEYTEDVMRTLTRPKLSRPEIKKLQRHEHKVLSVANHRPSIFKRV